MNRKKKINKILNKKLKQANAKKSGKSKPRYVAKADRENLADDSAETGIAPVGG